MKRVFISHSSEDKDFYVKPLVNRLIKTIGKDKIIYDNLTFETGAKSIKEIRDLMDNTDLFVLLISKNSLSSEWVQQEIHWARELEDKYFQEQRILPVIIDQDIDYKDERIPEWLTQYNLKVISSTKLSRIIFSRINQISWTNSAFLKEKNNLFVGRNQEMELFENRVNDFYIDKTNFIIASGMSTVGRKTFLKKALQKTGILKNTYSSPTISLDGHQSIEDFIKELSDLLDNKSKINNLMQISVVKKVDIAYKLLLELNDVLGDKLLIDDQGALVTHTGELSEWFIMLINKFNEGEYKDISTCIISRYKPYGIYQLKNTFHIPIDVLNSKDINKLLFQYSKLNGLLLEKSELADISQQFSGFPDEIFYAIDIIKQHSKQYLYSHTHLISEYSDNKIQTIIAAFSYSEDDHKVLKIISKLHVVSYESIQKILDLANMSNKIKDIERYIRHGIVKTLGVDGEYLTLNVAARNYYERQIHLEDKLKSIISKFVASIDINDPETDLFDENFVIQEKLISGEIVSQEKMIPSYYLKTMKVLYDSRKNRQVVNLADVILESSEVLDNYIRNEIQFFLCSSLARLKEKRFLDEVWGVSGYKHNFLFGFYYRQIGQYERAISKFNQVLDENPTYSQAKRELVLLYNKIGEYGKAYSMAKDNYDNNRNNPYHIHAYFQSVIYQNEDRIPLVEKRKILEELLRNFSRIESPNARNMYLISKAKYAMEVTVDYDEVNEIIAEMKSEFPEDNTYLLLFQVDFFEKVKKVEELEKVLTNMRHVGFDKKESNYHNDYLKCQIFISALNGNSIEWKNILKKLTVSDAAKFNIEERAKKLMNY